MIPSRYVLWVDCSGALLVGLAMFTVSGWLSGLYRLPRDVVLGIAAANVAYGCFSLSLAARPKRSRRAVITLASANAVWAGLCCVGAVAFWRDASVFGLAQFILEALFVAWLARIEWLYRDLLSPRDPAA